MDLCCKGFRLPRVSRTTLTSDTASAAAFSDQLVRHIIANEKGAPRRPFLSSSDRKPHKTLSFMTMSL